MLIGTRFIQWRQMFQIVSLFMMSSGRRKAHTTGAGGSVSGSRIQCFYRSFLGNLFNMYAIWILSCLRRGVVSKSFTLSPFRRVDPASESYMFTRETLHPYGGAWFLFSLKFEMTDHTCQLRKPPAIFCLPASRHPRCSCGEGLQRVPGWSQAWILDLLPLEHRILLKVELPILIGICFLLSMAMV